MSPVKRRSSRVPLRIHYRRWKDCEVDEKRAYTQRLLVREPQNESTNVCVRFTIWGLVEEHVSAETSRYRFERITYEE